MDYYGVTTDDILGLIDLDSLHVELSFQTSRSAKLCANAIREKILYRHRNIDSLRSDHAKEFVGVVLSRLKEEAGYKHTTNMLKQESCSMVSKEQQSKMRNLIISEICLTNAHRAGSIVNLTVTLVGKFV